MGQKIHPYGLRLGIVTDWKSRWYSEKDYARQVIEDAAVRKYLRDELRRGAISRIDIERIGDKKVQIDVHTARPGVVIGRGGSEADRLRAGLEDLTDRLVKFNVIEVQNAELDATLLARNVADQLEGRVSFRRAMKRAVSTALKAGAEGVRVQASGRLGGSDMGRREWYLEGRVPLHTLRADIDFGQATARTSVGAIGVKVWVYKGDVLPSLYSSREKIAAEARLAAGGPAQRRRSAKSRAEGGERGSRLIEAGGGKRLVEAGGGKRREGGGRRIIEAGGGRRVDPAEAQDEFESAREIADETIVADATQTAETVAEVGADAAPATPPETPEAVAEPETDAAPEIELVTDEVAEPEADAAPEIELVTDEVAESETEAAPEIELVTDAEPEDNAAAEPETEAAPEIELVPDAAAEPEVEAAPEPETEAAPEIELVTDAEPEDNAAAEPETEAAPEIELVTDGAADTAPPEVEAAPEIELVTDGAADTAPPEVEAAPEIELVTDDAADTAAPQADEARDNAGAPAEEAGHVTADDVAPHGDDAHGDADTPDEESGHVEDV